LRDKEPKIKDSGEKAKRILYNLGFLVNFYFPDLENLLRFESWNDPALVIPECLYRESSLYHP
jgi:hypothetical protein